jgi:hypothetical protein
MILINLNGCLTFDETMIILRKTRKCTKQMKKERERASMLCMHISFACTNEQ